MERLKRLNIYFKEMYPIVPRLGLGVMIFLEIYFIVLLNHGVGKEELLSFHSVEGQSALYSFFVQHDILGMLICSFTVFSFLLWLRIADDFKDYELDKTAFCLSDLFPPEESQRRIYGIFATILISFTLLINFLFMKNFIFLLYSLYLRKLNGGVVFQKHKIAKSLPLALVTHNPVQILLNLYVISYTIMKYKLPILDITNFMAVLTLYFQPLSGRFRERFGRRRRKRSM